MVIKSNMKKMKTKIIIIIIIRINYKMIKTLKIKMNNQMNKLLINVINGSLLINKNNNKTMILNMESIM